MLVLLGVLLFVLAALQAERQGDARAAAMRLPKIERGTEPCGCVARYVNTVTATEIIHTHDGYFSRCTECAAKEAQFDAFVKTHRKRKRH